VTTDSLTISLNQASTETFDFFRHTLQPQQRGDLEASIASLNPSDTEQVQQAFDPLDDGNGVLLPNYDSNSATSLISNDIHTLPLDPILDLLLSAGS